MKKKITDIILDKADGSTTEVARRLTVNSPNGEYYTVNQVAHWVRVDRIPPEHAAIVAQVFAMRIEDVAPYLFKATRNTTTTERGRPCLDGIED